MRKYLPVVIVGLFLASVAGAGAIHTWANGDTLTAKDLNANFNHIHRNMVGGHGPRLVNADVSATAAISKQKIANGDAVPKGWIISKTAGCGGTCTIDAHGGFATVGLVSSGAGTMAFTFTPARTNNNYAVIVSAYNSGDLCWSETYTTTGFTIGCQDSGGAATKEGFSLVLFDDNWLVTE